MKISSKTKYALLTVLDLTTYRNTGVIKVPDISRRQAIPQKFLEQILLILRNGGIVSSKRGARGGYYLTRPPSEISLAAIIRLTEKDLLPRGPGESSSEDFVFDDVWKEIDDYIEKKLENLDMQQISDSLATRAKVLEFSI
jgi:Rrf2 family protein